MFNLSIRTTKKEGSVPLFTRMRMGNTNHWINLLLKVDVEKWNDISQSERKIQNFLDKTGYGKKLVEIELGVKDLKRKGELTKDNVETLVQDIILAEQRQNHRDKELLGKEYRDRQMKSIEKYIITFVNRMESGEARSVKGELYAPQTIKAWKQFKRIFLDFYHINPFGWDDIDQFIINRFVTYLEENEYNKKTIAKYMRTFKQVVIDAENLGYHTNYTAKSKIRIPRVRECDKVKEIYLGKDVLEALFNMELEGKMAKARDLFLLGCYTGQRFSDFIAINESCIGVTAKGVDVIRLVQKKTGKPVVIPITDPNLITILKRYNFNPPYMSDQSLNKKIKKVVRKLSKKVKSLTEKEITILKKQEKIAEKRGRVVFERDRFGNVLKPRWQLVVSHTARRSCVTNMYLSGKYNISQMMAVSGHKQESTFREYIKLSLDEMAEMVAMSSKDGLF